VQIQNFINILIFYSDALLVLVSSYLGTKNQTIYILLCQASQVPA